MAAFVRAAAGRNGRVADENADKGKTDQKYGMNASGILGRK